MRIRSYVPVVALALSPGVVSAPDDAPRAPMAQAFRDDARAGGRALVAAAQAMPPEKYAFRPTPAQRSFGEIVAHAAQANDYLCGLVGGAAAPRRSAVGPNDGKAALLARLTETLAFCDRALAPLDDARLGEELAFLGARRTRAAVMTHAIADWESHYGQAAMYLRLNGLVPPTAK